MVFLSNPCIFARFSHDLAGGFRRAARAKNLHFSKVLSGFPAFRTLAGGFPGALGVQKHSIYNHTSTHGSTRICKVLADSSFTTLKPFLGYVSLGGQALHQRPAACSGIAPPLRAPPPPKQELPCNLVIKGVALESCHQRNCLGILLSNELPWNYVIKGIAL